MNRTDLSRVRVLAPETATASAPAQRRSREAALFERYRQLAAAAAAEEQAQAHAEDDEAADADDADNEAARDADRDEAQAEALAMQAAHAVHSLALYGGLHAGRYGGSGAATLALSSSSSSEALSAPSGQRETPQRGDQQSDADDRGSQQHDGEENNPGNGGQHGDGSNTQQPGAARSMSTASAQAVVLMQAVSAQAAAGAAASRSAVSASAASEALASRPTPPALTASGSPTPQPAVPATTSATASATAIGCMQVTALSAAAQAGSPPPHLLDYLVSQTAGFCTNPAALARGNWQLSLSLDPQQLPDCHLHLTLSHFDLVLRFDTVHPQSRQLISVHAATLRERLTALLAQSAPHRPRNIEITVS